MAAGCPPRSAAAAGPTPPDERLISALVGCCAAGLDAALADAALADAAAAAGCLKEGEGGGGECLAGRL